MPLNNLFALHQISLIRAAAAPSIEARQAHEALASTYSDQIAELGARSGATAAPLIKS